MNITNRVIICIYGVFFLILVVGCKNSSGSTESATIEQTSLVTPNRSIYTSTVINTPTTTPTLPLYPTNTPIPTPTGTSTPTYLPTLPPEQAKALILDLLQNNGGCRLPCWWGITPGASTWEDTLKIVSPIASEISISENAGIMDAAIYFNNAPEGIDQFGFDTKIKDGIVQDLFITSFGPIGIPFYSLSEVLSIYGEPGEVWVDAYGWPCDYANGPRLLNVSLFYPDQGFFVLYASWGDAEGIMIQACVDSDPLLYLWSPLLNLSYSEAFMRAGLQSGDNPSLPVSEAFGMDTAMFYQTYKGNGTMVCVETQRELWNWCDITPTPTP